MADRIALMRDGRIVQVGAPYHLYNHPVDRAAAGFFSDLNVIHSVVRDRQADTPFGLFLTPKLVDGADVEIISRPQHMKILEDNGAKPLITPTDGMPAHGRVVRARFIGAQSLIEVAMDHDGQRAEGDGALCLAARAGHAGLAQPAPRSLLPVPLRQPEPGRRPPGRPNNPGSLRAWGFRRA